MMKLLNSARKLPSQVKHTAATIGNFDGVHLGHQALLDVLLARAQALQIPSLVILFEPQPSEYFAGSESQARLSNLREKLDILRSYRIDYVCCLRFDQHLALMHPDEFVKRYLFSLLKVRHLLVGSDFRFGQNRSGDVTLLQKMGAENQLDVEIFNDYKIDQSRVSSTLIRQTLSHGNFSEVKNLLGRPYCLCGRVVCGDARGRQMGIPTANIRLNRKKVAIRGVFCVRVKRIDGPWLYGVANVGNRPTVDGQGKPILEVHLFDFNESLYGEMLQVCFMEKLRDETRFSSLDVLVSQIHRDIADAKTYFKTKVINE